MPRFDADEVLAMGPASLINLLQEVYIEAGVDDADLDEALSVARDRPVAVQDLARLIWKRVELLNECDRQPGLRSKVARVAAGGVFPAISESLVRLLASRIEVTALITICDNHLWIADLVFPYLLFPMEMNRWGIGPGWDGDPQASDLVAQPLGPSGTFLRWASWVAVGDLQRGYIASARYLGAYPARGIPLASPRVASLVRAVREEPPSHPVVVISAPALLGFYVSRVVPSVSVFVERTRAVDERVGGTFGLFPMAMYRAMAGDPLAALASILARAGDTSPLKALTLQLRTACAYAVCRAHLREDGVWQAPVRAVGRLLQPLRALRSGKHLVVHADSVVAIATTLGLVPWRCVMSSGQRESWDWSTLRACGWSQLEGDDLLQRVRVSGLDGLWLRFPAGGMPRELPDSGFSCQVTTEDTPMRDMDLNLPWYPPSD